jgi:hypothetical protein
MLLRVRADFGSPMRRLESCRPSRFRRRLPISSQLIGVLSGFLQQIACLGDELGE